MLKLYWLFCVYIRLLLFISGLWLNCCGFILPHGGTKIMGSRSPSEHLISRCLIKHYQWYFSPSEVDQGRPPIKVKFEIPYFTVSGIQVTYYKTVVPLIILVINKSAVVRGRSRSFAVVRFCFTLSLVRLQTELDFTQSYHHYICVVSISSVGMQDS